MDTYMHELRSRNLSTRLQTQRGASIWCEETVSDTLHTTPTTEMLWDSCSEEDFGKTVMVETCTTAALHCHARRHCVSESHELVVCAGRVARERRYSSAARRGRRCFSESSASTPSSSQRSSLSIMSFTGLSSRLGCRILRILLTEGRPFEAATLKNLLKDSSTCNRAEQILHHTVGQLVAQLQSAHPTSRVLRNIRPLLMESGHFLNLINQQHPAKRQCYSWPIL
ncbi:hypothetical protein GBAR_LOCUS30229 [Geodia barretti]|nr:hypothetical protein GBAR_LOCUS30229 [Geodia barretti]